MVFLTPHRNGIDDTLPTGAMPALDLSQERASRFEEERSKMILRLVELRHERINHHAQQGLLHGKRTHVLSERGALLVLGKALISLMERMWVKRFSQMAGADFHHRICHRLKW